MIFTARRTLKSFTNWKSWGGVENSSDFEVLHVTKVMGVLAAVDASALVVKVDKGAVEADTSDLIGLPSAVTYR